MSTTQTSVPAFTVCVQYTIDINAGMCPWCGEKCATEQVAQRLERVLGRSNDLSAQISDTCSICGLPILWSVGWKADGDDVGVDIYRWWTRQAKRETGLDFGPDLVCGHCGHVHRAGRTVLSSELPGLGWDIRPWSKLEGAGKNSLRCPECVRLGF